MASIRKVRRGGDSGLKAVRLPSRHDWRTTDEQEVEMLVRASSDGFTADWLAKELSPTAINARLAWMRAMGDQTTKALGEV